MTKIKYFVMAVAIMLGGLVVGTLPTVRTVHASDIPLANGDFETGDLTGWTPFTTTNGTLGFDYPQVVIFDTNDDGTATYSAQFSVGQASNDNLTKRGGGIYQTVHLAQGDYAISADIAVAFGTPEVGTATQGGLFELLVDGVVVASHNFGYVYVNTTQHSLIASVPITSTGYHEIRVRITRPGNSAPELNQYIDNVVLSGDAISTEPEPTEPAPTDSKPGKSGISGSGQSSDTGKNCNYQDGSGNKGGNLDNCNAGSKK